MRDVAMCVVAPEWGVLAHGRRVVSELSWRLAPETAPVAWHWKQSWCPEGGVRGQMLQEALWDVWLDRRRMVVSRPGIAG